MAAAEPIVEQLFQRLTIVSLIAERGQLFVPFLRQVEFLCEQLQRLAVEQKLQIFSVLQHFQHRQSIFVRLCEVGRVVRIA